MPERQKLKIARNMVLGFGALYLAFKGAQAYQNFDPNEAALAGLRFITDYEAHLRNGSVEGVIFQLPQRLPLDKRLGFSELVAAPETNWRTVRAALIRGEKVTQIEERPSALTGLTIQVSQELPDRPRKTQNATLAETVIKIVGEDFLHVPNRPSVPRYTDSGFEPEAHEMPDAIKRLHGLI